MIVAKIQDLLNIISAIQGFCKLLFCAAAMIEFNYHILFGNSLSLLHFFIEH